MSFRDDFNTLNTDIWQITSNIPEEKRAIYCQNGWLRIKVTGPYSNGWVFLTFAQAANLTKKKLDILIGFPDSYYHAGISAGFELREVDGQRGVRALLYGNGYENISGILFHVIFADGSIRVSDYKRVKAHPVSLSIKVGEKGVYFYVNDELAHFWYRHFDYNQVIPKLYMAGEFYSGDAYTMVDFIQWQPTEVLETEPYKVEGTEAELQVFAPQVLSLLLNGLIPPLIGSSLISLAEGVVKKK